jgi:hypothetical protein
MWISTSEGVVEVQEASEGREARESPQMEDMVARRLALSTRKPGLEREWDERDDQTCPRSGGRQRTAFGDMGEVDDLSGMWTGLGMIGGRLRGIDHSSGSGEGGKTGAGLVRRGHRR